MADKAEETKKEVVKEEVKKAPAARQVTKVWNGVGWVEVEEGSANYKAGKTDQS